MRTLRFPLPVLIASDADDLLAAVVRVEGVVAALVDESAPALEVVLAREATALLVREEVRHALLAGWAQAVRA